MNHPMHDHSPYFAAIRAAAEQLETGLAGLHRQEDESAISPVDAARRRVVLLERHLAACQRARREYLAGS